MGLYVIYYSLAKAPAVHLSWFVSVSFGTGNEREFSCGHPLLR